MEVKLLDHTKLSTVVVGASVCYDPEIKKFVKNKGAYSITCVEKEYPGSKYSIAENKKDFIVFNERGETEAFLDKWYRADYSKYYMGDEI